MLTTSDVPVPTVEDIEKAKLRIRVQENPYHIEMWSLLGAAPTSLDAAGYGLLSSVLFAPFALPIQAEVDELKNFAAYCERLEKQYSTDA